MIARLVSNFALPPIRILGEKTKMEFEMEWMASHAEEELEKIQYYPDINSAAIDLELLIGTSMIQGKDRGQFLEPGEPFRSKLCSVENPGIIFGREDRGLSRTAIDACDFMLDFCLPGNQKSMNLSHSVSYVLGLLAGGSYQNQIKQEENLHTDKMYEIISSGLEKLGVNSFHGMENLAIKRIKKILENGMDGKGDRDFIFKILRKIEEVG